MIHGRASFLQISGHRTRLESGNRGTVVGDAHSEHIKIRRVLPIPVPLIQTTGLILNVVMVSQMVSIFKNPTGLKYPKTRPLKKSELFNCKNILVELILLGF